MARSAFDPAFSTLDQYQFAGGRSIGTPGAAPIDNTPNPYAAMAGEMVGELAYNAGAEYMAPEGEWNEELGKWVYTKKPYSSIFGDYTIPEDSVWSTQVPVLQKQAELAAAKEAKQGKERLKEFNSMFNPSIVRPLTRFEAMKYDDYNPEVNSKIINKTEREEFIPKDASQYQTWKGEGDELKSYINRLDVATTDVLKRYKEEKTFMGIGDYFKPGSEREAHRLDSEFLNWALQAGDSLNLKYGAGGHFYKTEKLIIIF